ncbi:MAG: tetratricopeptide (TPR) repeat protein, partial [Planctomycetota bacterium]
MNNTGLTGMRKQNSGQLEINPEHNDAMNFRISFLSFVLSLFLFTGDVVAEDGENKIFEDSLSSQSLQEHQAEIARLESEKGAYHPALRGALINSGEWYRSQGDYVKATDVYERALHISKVDKGMHNPAQIELVELLVESYSALQDWQSLDNNL